jgi:hypothetical protein
LRPRRDWPDIFSSLQPLIDFGLALEALDVAKLGTRIVSFDLPLVFGDALVFEFDSGFAYAPLMAVFGRRGQRACPTGRGGGAPKVRQEPT